MIDRIKNLFKSLNYKYNPEIPNGSLGVGWTPEDFTLGSIKSLPDVLKESDIQDNDRFQWNQYKNRWSINSCTLVAPICSIASIFNRKLTEREMKDFWNYAKKESGYKEGVGNTLKNGVDTACKYWNNKLCKPGQEVIYFLTLLTSEDAKQCMLKGYSMNIEYSGNQSYNLDKNDRLLSGVKFGERTYAHATTMYMTALEHWIYDSNFGEFDDSYKIYPGNLNQLVSNGVYTNTCYVILPIGKAMVAKPKTKLQLYLEKIKEKYSTGILY